MVEESAEVDGLESLKTAIDNPILGRENFFEIVNNELNKNIVGENQARKLILLVCNLRNVSNAEATSSNLIINAESGTGKDYVTKKTLDILPEGCIEKRERISPTAFNYWHNGEKEPDFSWDKKVCYLEDVSNNILNCDPFKLLASSSNGMKATIVVNNRAVDYSVNGKPVMLVTTATGNLRKELLRRFALVNLTETTDQTKAVVERRLEYAKKGIRPRYDPRITQALGCLRRIHVKIPWAIALSEHLPCNNIILRTTIDRLLDYIKSSCSFHQFNREVEGKYRIATKQDYELGRECFISTLSNPFFVPVNREQTKIIEIMKSLGQGSFSIPQLSTSITFMSDRWLRKQMDKLTDIGFCEKNREIDSEINRYVITYRLKEIVDFKLPSWEDLGVG